MKLCNEIVVRLAAVCIALLLGHTGALAAGRVECSTIQSKAMGRAVKYCALLPPSYDREKAKRFPVIYYLHGLGDNEQSLVNLGGWNLVEDLQERGRIGEFLIVAPDGGRSFYVNSRDGRRPYEDFFIKEFLPAMESKFRIRAARHSRALLGISMGGYGALRFAFKYPEKFGAVATHMAALIEKLPPGLADARTLSPRLGVLNEIFGQPLDRALWERNSPFRLAKESTNVSGLKIYLDCGNQDDYGFDSGAQAMHDLLKSRGIAHEFHIYPGGHSWFYVAEHLGASLEFLSRAMGLAREVR